MRAILYMVAAALAILLLRSIIGLIAKAFSDFASPAPSAGPDEKPKRPTVPISEALERDPVCGTFIAPSAAVQKTVAGTTYYFCSAACRDKFRAA